MVSNNKKLIDFFGLHGSGKSTVYKATIELAVAEGVDLNLVTLRDFVPKWRKYPVLLCLVFIKIKDIFFILYFFHRYAVFGKYNRQRMFSLLRLFLQTEYEYKSQSFDFYLHDGILHKLIDVEFCSSSDVNQIFDLFWQRFKYKYVAIVIHEIDEKTYYERVEIRYKKNKGFAKYMDDNKVASVWLERSRQQYQIMRDIIKNSDVPFLVLAGSDKVERKAEQVLDFVLRLR